jgi:hypothetical protein
VVGLRRYSHVHAPASNRGCDTRGLPAVRMASRERGTPYPCSRRLVHVARWLVCRGPVGGGVGHDACSDESRDRPWLTTYVPPPSASMVPVMPL